MKKGEPNYLLPTERLSLRTRVIISWYRVNEMRTGAYVEHENGRRLSPGSLACEKQKTKLANLEIDRTRAIRLVREVAHSCQCELPQEYALPFSSAPGSHVTITFRFDRRHPYVSRISQLGGGAWHHPPGCSEGWG